MFIRLIISITKKNSTKRFYMINNDNNIIRVRQRTEILSSLTRLTNRKRNNIVHLQQTALNQHGQNSKRLQQQFAIKTYTIREIINRYLV